MISPSFLGTYNMRSCSTLPLFRVRCCRVKCSTTRSYLCLSQSCIQCQRGSQSDWKRKVHSIHIYYKYKLFIFTLFRCTSLYGTPTMFVDILNLPNLKKYNLKSLSTGIMAGAPCPQEVAKGAVNKLNMKDFMVLVGLFVFISRFNYSWFRFYTAWQNVVQPLLWRYQLIAWQYVVPPLDFPVSMSR